jgi:hypothetical protein
VSIVPRDPCEPITGAMRLLLEWDYPDADRILLAMRLALDVGACEDLLAGRPVDPSRLDQAELAKAREKTLVRLVAPIDRLGDVAA